MLPLLDTVREGRESLPRWLPQLWARRESRSANTAGVMDHIEEVWQAVADTEPVLSPQRVFQLLCGRFPQVYGHQAHLKGLSFVGSTLNSHAKRPEPTPRFPRQTPQESGDA